MIWNVKKINETDSTILIGFSKDSTLDGRIRYDKKADSFELEKLAHDCDEAYSRWLFQFLYGLLMDDRLSNKPYSVRIG